MASKKAKLSLPLSLWMSSANASDVSGPEATIVKPSLGMVRTSSRHNSINGSASIAAVTTALNCWRSTARAPPAGTAHCSAKGSSLQPKLRNSACNTPPARSGNFEPKELEQTNSAQLPLSCAAVGFCGRISYRRTLMPSAANCRAASEPAKPAPIMLTTVISCDLGDT